MIHVIVGPPCSGKSQYVADHASNGDVLVDYDLIAKALGSRISHGSAGSVRSAALAARRGAISKILSGLDGDSWVIHTSPAPDLMQSYADAGATFVVLDPGKDVCLARASSDDRPPGTIATIDAWYDGPPEVPQSKRVGAHNSTGSVEQLFQAMHSFIGREIGKHAGRSVPGIPGKDGAAGPVGPAGGEGPVGPSGATGEKGIDGRDGREGKDGRDGIATTDELVKLVEVEVVKRLELEVARQMEIAIKSVPRMEFKGVWKPGEYAKGDCTQSGGDMWMCKAESTTEAPGGSADWVLVVRKGRDGNRGTRI